jgi:hypothetical protein
MCIFRHGSWQLIVFRIYWIIEIIGRQSSALAGTGFIVIAVKANVGRLLFVDLFQLIACCRICLSPEAWPAQLSHYGTQLDLS